MVLPKSEIYFTDEKSVPISFGFLKLIHVIKVNMSRAKIKRRVKYQANIKNEE